MHYLLLGTIFINTPSFGVNEAVSTSSHGILVCWLVTTVNLLNKVASVNLHSVMANRIPIQFFGPAPNGRYTIGCLLATFSGVNLWKQTRDWFISIFEMWMYVLDCVFGIQFTVLTIYINIYCSGLIKRTLEKTRLTFQRLPRKVVY